MPRNLEIVRFLDLRGGGWSEVAVACSTAADVVSTTVLTPNHYTSTGRVLIEPPVGSYLCGAATGSPINESIELYELGAWGNRLFLDAIERELTLYITEQTVKPVRVGAAEMREQSVVPHTVAQLARRDPL